MASLGEATESHDILIGGSLDDTIEGTDGRDIIEGGSHIDLLFGGAGRDIVLGGSGDDVVSGGEGRDVVRGGSGDDVVGGGADNDIVRGDTGADLVTGDGGDDLLFGDEGNDSIYGGEGDDVLVGGAGDDQMIGGEGADRFVYFAEAGDDIIQRFEVGIDVIDLRMLPEAIAFADLTIVDMEDRRGITITHDALDGSIEIRGTSAAEISEADFLMPDGTITTVPAENGNVSVAADPFVGTDVSELMTSHAGGSTILALGGADDVLGGEGDDRIEGGEGADDLFGEEGDDVLEGGVGNDRLFGGEGNDSLDGGTESDWLFGGEGDDRLTGGADADTFVFTPDHGTDTITDFADGEDLIDLSALAGIAGFEDLEVETYGNAALIDLTCHGGGLVLLEDTLASDLDATDFVFYEPPADLQPIDGM